MPVNTVHPEYMEYADKWRRTRAASNSDVDRDEYLPAPFKDTEPDRYKAYKDRAYFLGVTGRTQKAMGGMVFRKPAVYDLPSELEYLLEDFDGSGQSAEQIAKDCLAGLLQTRRQLLLTDYPDAGEGLTAEQERMMNLRPTIASYTAESLINWRWAGVNGQRKLVLAVLRESDNKADDEFQHDYKTVYRVLRLTDGVYTQQMYDDSLDPITEPYAPRMAGGGYFDRIPLHGVRELENPPLYDIAQTNLAHYRNIADLEDAAYVVGQPMVHIDIGQTTPETWKEHNPDGIKFGSRNGVVTQGGSLDLKQASENNLIRQVKQDKEQEMIMLGAQLITRGGQAQTAEAERLQAGAEASVLDTLVNDLSEDMEAAIEDAALFIGVNPESVSYQLNTDYWEQGLDPQTFMAVVQGYQTNLYGQVDALNMIRKGKIELDAGRTDDDIQQDVADNLLNDNVGLELNNQGGRSD